MFPKKPERSGRVNSPLAYSEVRNGFGGESELSLESIVVDYGDFSRMMSNNDSRICFGFRVEQIECRNRSGKRVLFAFEALKIDV